MKILIAAILVSACSPLSAQSDAKLTVVLSKLTRIESAYVSLAQIATLSGEADLMALAGSVLLGRAPEPGASRRIKLRSIRQRILTSGIDTDEIAFYGYSSPVVRGKGGDAPAADLDAGIYTPPPRKERKPEQKPPQSAPAKAQARPAATKPEAARTGRQVNDLVGLALKRIEREIQRVIPDHEGKLVVREIARNRALRKLRGDQLLLLTVRSRNAARGLGRLDYQLVFDRDGKELRGHTLTVEVGLEVPRVTLKQDLGRGDRLSAADLTVKTVFTTKLNEPGYALMAEVTGSEATRKLSKGQVVLREQIQPALLVKRGQTVTVKALLPGGGSVLVTGVARSNGYLGKLIVVSRKVPGRRKPVEMTARVSGEGVCVAE